MVPNKKSNNQHDSDSLFKSIDQIIVISFSQLRFCRANTNYYSTKNVKNEIAIYKYLPAIPVEIHFSLVHKHSPTGKLNN